MGQYYICSRDGVEMGMIMIHFETSLELGGRVHWINSVYVHPDHRKLGVFSFLYSSVVRKAREAGARAVRLYVETSNATAIAVYQKMGMHVLTASHEFHEVDYN